MTRNLQLRLSGRLSIIVALAGMWLLGCIGIFLLRCYDRSWFIRLRGYDIGTLGQIGFFYMARFGAQIPALAFAAYILGASTLRRPIRAAFWTALALHTLLLAIRAAKWPWSAYRGLDQSIPVLAECVSLVFIVACTVFLTWVVRRFRI